VTERELGSIRSKFFRVSSIGFPLRFGEARKICFVRKLKTTAQLVFTIGFSIGVVSRYHPGVVVQRGRCPNQDL
jgi:hypothetical protein